MMGPLENSPKKVILVFDLRYTESRGLLLGRLLL